MRKIATTTDGNVIVEMNLDEWKHIELSGLDIILESAEKDRQHEAKEKEWRNSTAFEILEPLFSKGLYTPMRILFYAGKFDGSIEQLRTIARGEYPFENIANIGKTKRKILLDALSKRNGDNESGLKL